MIEIAGAILAAMLTSSLFKAKPYCLWQREWKTVAGALVGIWANTNPAGNSARRCRKAAAVYLDCGVKADDLVILPKGIAPPKEQ